MLGQLNISGMVSFVFLWSLTRWIQTIHGRQEWLADLCWRVQTSPSRSATTTSSSIVQKASQRFAGFWGIDPHSWPLSWTYKFMPYSKIKKKKLAVLLKMDGTQTLDYSVLTKQGHLWLAEMDPTPDKSKICGSWKGLLKYFFSGIWNGRSLRENNAFCENIHVLCGGDFVWRMKRAGLTTSHNLGKGFIDRNFELCGEQENSSNCSSHGPLRLGLKSLKLRRTS